MPRMTTVKTKFTTRDASLAESAIDARASGASMRINNGEFYVDDVASLVDNLGIYWLITLEAHAEKRS